MLLAEELLLLVLDDETGRAQGSSSYLRPALGGALLAELALDGAVRVERSGPLRSQAVVSTGEHTPVDPLLAEALLTVTQKPRSPRDVVQRLGKDLQGRLAGRLAERGVVERRDDKLLGLFPRTSWPAVDSSHEEQVRRRLADVLLRGADPDPCTAALVALLRAIGRAHKVVDREGLPAGEVKRRAKQATEDHWPAKAAKEAIDAATAALVAVTAAGAVAGSS